MRVKSSFLNLRCSNYVALSRTVCASLLSGVSRVAFHPYKKFVFPFLHTRTEGRPLSDLNRCTAVATERNKGFQKDLYDGGTRSGGSLAGIGCPLFAVSTRYIANTNSSHVNFPSLSTSARFLDTDADTIHPSHSVLFFPNKIPFGKQETRRCSPDLSQHRMCQMRLCQNSPGFHSSQEAFLGAVLHVEHLCVLEFAGLWHAPLAGRHGSSWLRAHTCRGSHRCAETTRTRCKRRQHELRSPPTLYLLSKTRRLRLKSVWFITQHGEILPESFSSHFKKKFFFGKVELRC